jgi:hypothetical protein
MIAVIREVPAVTTLGVQCTSSCAFLAVADGDAVLKDGPERLTFRSGLAGDEQLTAFAAEVAQLVRDVAPARVLLLQAVSNYTASHTAWVGRIAMETLFRLEAARAGVECSYVSHQAVKGAFALKGKGGLGKLGADSVTRTGRYWNEGRLLAALAAVTGEKKS